MMKKIAFSILLVTAITGYSLQAADISFRGAGGSVGVMSGAMGAMTLSAHANLGEIIPNLVLYPSIEYFGVSFVNVVSLNSNVRYYFPLKNSPVDWFAGGGLGLSMIKVDYSSVLGPLGSSSTPGFEYASTSFGVGINAVGGADYSITENLVTTGKLAVALNSMAGVKVVAGITYMF